MVVVVAGEQQGLGHGRAQAQNESGSLEKLGRGEWRLTTATSRDWGRLLQRVQRCCWVSGRWCWRVGGGREGAKP